MNKHWDSYRIEVFTQSCEAKELRNLFWTHMDEFTWKEHAYGGGSIFLFVATSNWRERIFREFGKEKWFAMEGGIIRNVETWEID